MDWFKEKVHQPPRYPGKIMENPWKIRQIFPPIQSMEQCFSLSCFISTGYQTNWVTDPGMAGTSSKHLWQTHYRDTMEIYFVFYVFRGWYMTFL